VTVPTANRDQWTVFCLLWTATLGLCLQILLRGATIDDCHGLFDRSGYCPRIRVNSCDWPELCLLPGVSEKTARRIVANRLWLGPFAEPGELERIPGIGPKTRQALSHQLDFSCSMVARIEWDRTGESHLE
jgi:hypothetical protein